MKIFIKAKPGAHAAAVTKVSGNVFIISVTEPPEEGRANQAITKALAEYFNIAPSLIRLKQGETSKTKIFEIPNGVSGGA